MKEIKNKKKYEFTEEETKDIVEKYKSGLPCSKISENYPCSSKTIERYLRRIGVSALDNPKFSPIQTLPKEDVQYIISSFINGKSATTLAKEYNCNEGTIRKLLNNNNVTFRDAKHYNLKNFTKEEIDIIVEQYKNGLTLVDLTVIYKSNYKTLRKLIPDNIFEQYKSKSKRMFKKYKDFSIDEKRLIVDKYLQGNYQKDLAYEFNCSIEVIHNILKELNIQGKDNPNWDKEIKQFDIEQKDKIIELYLNGMIQEDISIQFNCSRDYIRRILNEYGYSYKDNPNYNYGISEEISRHSDDIIKLYSEGTSINQIKEQYKVSGAVISQILTDNNIEIKTNMNNYSDEELLQFLKDIYDDYGFVNSYLINSLENCPTGCTYTSRFKTLKNAMELADLPYSSSMFILGDEICKSGFEYRLSLVLKKYNIEYDRDYMYRNIIPDYTRKHSLDYKIYYKDSIIYCEIFGMSGSTFNNNKYNNTKKLKLDLCSTYNIHLLELYPEDFNLNNEKFEEHIFNKLNEYNNNRR